VSSEQYVSDVQRDQVLSLLFEVGRMLNAMIAKAEQFCGSAEEQ
jgi:hypothetical protein